MKAASRLSHSLRRLVGDLETRWSDSGQSRSASVLRTALLRELMQRLHAERSLRLAEKPARRGESPHHPSVREISRIESQIASLCGRDVAAGTLAEALDSAPPGTAPPADLPWKVATALGADRLDRADRRWEAAIAAHAARHGWSFWALEAWVRLRTAEAFHEFLSRSIWPRGVVLYVEASTPPEDRKALEFREHWRGRWITAFEPGDPGAPPEPQGYPGLLTEPEAPRWTLLAKADKEEG